MDRHGAREVSVVRLLDARPVGGRAAVGDAVDDGHCGDAHEVVEVASLGAASARPPGGQQLTEVCESCVTFLPYFPSPRPGFRMRPEGDRLGCGGWPRPPTLLPSSREGASARPDRPPGANPCRVESSSILLSDTRRKMGLR